MINPTFEVIKAVNSAFFATASFSQQSATLMQKVASFGKQYWKHIAIGSIAIAAGYGFYQRFQHGSSA